MLTRGGKSSMIQRHNTRSTYVNGVTGYKKLLTINTTLLTSSDTTVVGNPFRPTNDVIGVSSIFGDHELKCCCSRWKNGAGGFLYFDLYSEHERVAD